MIFWKKFFLNKIFDFVKLNVFLNKKTYESVLGERLFINKISKLKVLTICPERTKCMPVFKTQTQLDRAIQKTTRRNLRVIRYLDRIFIIGRVWNRGTIWKEI